MDDGHIVVDSIEEITIKDITHDLAREGGFQSVDDLLKIAKHGPGQNVYRFASTISSPARGTRRLLKRSFFRSARVLVDLTNRAKMIGEVRDAVDQAGQLDTGPTQQQDNTTTQRQLGCQSPIFTLPLG